jgi:aryl carrier-like protein
VGEGPVTIGRPIANTQLYILDEGLQPVPRGVRGELYIGGAGVARGYLNRPDLTAERFIADPFGAAGGRLYRTGDLARYLADGRVQYLGRRDSQVKIRGFRIELAEIEAVLRVCDGVQLAAVTTFVSAEGERYIAAYIVPAPAGAPPFEELRRSLASVLPDYMLPATFVQLDALPLTPNNKVDYASLPKPDFNRAARTYIAPRNLDEHWLARLWQETLQIERVGVTDDFFELGGHSLAAMKLIARARERFGVDIKLQSLFDTPNIAQWSESLRALRPPAAQSPARHEQTAAILARIRAMSDEEVANAL